LGGITPRTSDLEVNELMPKLQSADRKHHSTETAVLRVLSDILTAMDNQQVTLLALLDLSAAFDCIDHDILRPVYSETTQLNSTRRLVELSCVGEVSIATPTQLNSTRLTCFALIGCTLQLGQLHCRSSATVELRR